MRLRKITLRHFRNVGFATLECSGRQQFLLGANGQGKTNLLEAAGFVTALRSFRAPDHKLLIGHGQSVAAVAAELDHERQGVTRVTIKLRRDGKELWCDQARVTRLADHLGKFPTVVFSSQDLLLVRGAPAGRRRWLDLTLAAMDAGYLRALQTYGRALAERNALLKAGRAAEGQLAAFEQLLAPAAAELITHRAAGLRELGAILARTYGQVCDRSEPAAISYEPNFAEPSAEALLARLEAGRARDAQFRTTLTGPHRDDFRFHVRGTAAKDFASEGQQRSLVLALRLAQAAWCHGRSGVRPVLLADDVLGELDPDRRRRFWAATDPESQVIATGTSLPDAALGTWQVFAVADGTFTPKVRRVTHLEPWQWALAVVGALAIGLAKTGINGLGMLAVVIFANLLPARQASGVVLPMLVLADVVAVAAYRQHAQWRYLWKLIPWTAAGIVAGYLALGRIDDRQAGVLVGLIILAMLGMHLWRRRRANGTEPEHAAWFAPVIGMLAGFTTLVANAAGPLMAIYLLAMRLPKMEYMGTGAIFFLLMNLFKVPFMANLGLVNGPSLWLNLVLAPAVLAGALLGRRILAHVDQKLFEQLALGLSAVAGIKLLF